MLNPSVMSSWDAATVTDGHPRATRRCDGRPRVAFSCTSRGLRERNVRAKRLGGAEGLPVLVGGQHWWLTGSRCAFSVATTKAVGGDARPHRARIGMVPCREALERNQPDGVRLGSQPSVLQVLGCCPSGFGRVSVLYAQENRRGGDKARQGEIHTHALHNLVAIAAVVGWCVDH